MAKERMNGRYFAFTMLCMLAHILYQYIDTFMLIINDIPLQILHVFHHATTYIAYYTGFFTGGGKVLYLARIKFNYKN